MPGPQGFRAGSIRYIQQALKEKMFIDADSPASSGAAASLL